MTTHTVGEVNAHHARGGMGMQIACALVMAAAWWARCRFAVSTGEIVGTPLDRWITGAALVVSTLFAVRVQRALAGGRSHVLPTLAVCAILGGLVAAFGATPADALLSVAMGAVLLTACATPPRRRGPVVLIGFSVAVAVAVLMVRADWLGAARPRVLAMSYGNQWRMASDVWDVVFVAWMLGALGALGGARDSRLMRAVLAVVVIESLLIVVWPVSLGHFAVTMSVPAVALCGSGWNRLRAHAYENASPALRGLVLTLTVGLGLWIWPPLSAIGHVLTVAMFGA